MGRLGPVTITALWLAIFAGGARAQDVSGTGQQATDLFPLRAGLVTFDLEYHGEGTFTARLLDDHGELIEQLASTRGRVRTSRTVRVPRTGQYFYDISATGTWTVRVRGPTREEPAAAAIETAPAAALLPLARSQGEQEANRVGTFPYMMGGLLGGVVAGPIGAGAAFAVASRHEVSVPPQTLAALAEHEPLYVREFTAAYQSRLRANRRTATLVGGAVGTVVFLFLLAQIVDWGSVDADSAGPPTAGTLNPGSF